MRRFTIAAALMLLILISPVFAKGLTIVHASDIHHFSRTLIEDEGFFRFVMENGDGKDSIDSEAIARTFAKDMLELRPDAVLISGDLTYNGERESHNELRGILSLLKDSGIPVYVIPGNHDVNQKAYRFTDDGVEAIDSFRSLEFEEFWWDYGYGAGFARDPWSNSYFARLSDEVWLLAVDSNTGSKGTVRTRTLDWMEENLREARRKGVRVISMTHQNLFVHNSRFTWGYQLDNASKLLALYAEYGVKLNLSGHLHIQNIVQKDGITDIAVSALVNSPLQYGIIRIRDGIADYETRSISDSRLAADAGAVFDKCTASRLSASLSAMEDEDMAVRMEDVAVQLNREFFQGCISDYDEEALWLLKETGIPFADYLDSFAGDFSDYRVLKGIGLE